MFIDNNKLRDILLKSEMVDQQTWDDVVANANRLNMPVEDLLKERDIIAGHVLYELVSAAINIPYVNLHTHDILPEVLDLVNGELVNKYQAIPFEIDKSKKIIKVAFIDPLNQKAINFFKNKTKYRVDIYLTGKEGFKSASKYYQKEIVAKIKKGLKMKAASVKNGARNILSSLVEYAFYAQPSDIHIEHLKEGGVIKCRLDGFLKDEFFVSNDLATELVNSIKQSSNFKTNREHPTADGRFCKEVRGESISFRVSVMPTYYGEKACLRVLDESKQQMSLRDLGFNENDIELIKNEAKKPYGLILVSGPTGSGKSSTLYTIVKSLNVEGVSIATIEDPIEYSIKHINQTQVDADYGYTFAKGLRSLLRQDPNILMVGEIRDNETAEITIQAALTGHIVLSTLHSNTAAGSITRLKNMGIKSYLLAPTLNISIAQRLVKKICPYCRESYQLDKEFVSRLDKDTGLVKSLEKLKKLSLLNYDNYDDIRFYRAKGCSKCSNKGYKGRIGVFEILNINSEIAKLIIQDKSEVDIAKLAEQNGMLTIFEDGIIKVTNGLTTIEEVIRVLN